MRKYIGLVNISRKAFSYQALFEMVGIKIDDNQYYFASYRSSSNVLSNFGSERLQICIIRAL